ncbi:MAG: hypothetical protein D8M52_08155 [Chlorobi bacterium]|nr:MAG: hypothetical protein F9K28_04710 [Bacteroidota bacterium]KXK32449.1 MAG: hypothetical protein UZ06_CHB003002079 [Chlorobi bacterium OLB6]MBE2265733.1 hypothetical protein [Flavobacteriales bacterium]MBL1161675.1 hypothetical protein [Chlorobiota bacterium]MBW7852700.1 hypothetical protein [Candidatus Kapabacteria bacterium]MCC6331040.1 hypothetical protein [Ignavibacteria bacterium]
MNPGFITLLLGQIVAGMGIMGATRTRMPRSIVLPVAFLLGMFVHSVLFFGVDLFRLGLNDTMLIATGILAVVVPHLWWKHCNEFYKWLFSKPRLTLTMYDVAMMAFVGSTAYYVIWASWYWPVTPFDAMAGIDLVARQTVEEGTIVNRVFTEPLLQNNLSNQPFYAPFAMLMQVMYRIAGFAYGQLWLGMTAFFVSWGFWGVLRQVVHPFLANILFVLLILTPELLGYTYLLQTDYLNAAYWCMAAMLTYLTFEKKTATAYWPAAILLAGAAWSRTETVILVFLALAGLVLLWRRTLTAENKITFLAASGVLSLLMFALWNGIFLQYYLPVRPSTASQLVAFDVSRFVQVTLDFFVNVLANYGLWGITFLAFVVVLVIGIVKYRSAGSVQLLIWLGAVVTGLLLVGTVFSAAIVEQTLRRGVFKLVPIIYLYIAASALLAGWSSRMRTWEMKQ